MKSALLFIVCLVAFGCAPKSMGSSYATRGPGMEVLHGTGLYWGMGQNEVSHVLHARITHGEPHHLDEYSIADRSFDGLPASYSLFFTNGQRLSSFFIKIQRPVDAAAQSHFASLLPSFIKLYGQPVAVRYKTSAAGEKIEKNIWVTHDDEVSLTIGPNMNNGMVTALIIVEQRVRSDQAIVVQKTVLENLAPGTTMKLPWADRPVFIIKRTLVEVNRIRSMQPLLQKMDIDKLGYYVASELYGRPLSQDDPFVHTVFRSIRPELGIYLAIDTIGGCLLNYEDLSKEPRTKSPEKGMGFFDPCHDLAYDTAGWPRGPDTETPPLMIPKHHYEANGDLVIGR